MKNTKYYKIYETTHRICMGMSFESLLNKKLHQKVMTESLKVVKDILMKISFARFICRTLKSQQPTASAISVPESKHL